MCGPSPPFPANIYLFKVSNRNTRKRCEICSNVAIKTPERRHWCRSGVFIVNFEQISHRFLVFLLLTLSMLLCAGFSWVHGKSNIKSLKLRLSTALLEMTSSNSTVKALEQRLILVLNNNSFPTCICLLMNSFLLVIQPKTCSKYPKIREEKQLLTSFLLTLNSVFLVSLLLTLYRYLTARLIVTPLFTLNCLFTPLFVYLVLH